MAPSPTPKSPVRVALVGYGLAGKVFHAPLIEATPGLELRAIVSSRPDNVHADRPDMTVLPDLDTALSRDDLDLFVIATPDALHAEQAMAALKAGKHVVVDKPFATSLQQAEQVMQVASAAKGTLSVFQNRRWDADFLTLQRLIAEGALGQIAVFESHFDRFRPQPGDRWKDRREGGVWMDLGPHLVDQALTLFGAPQSVLADLAIQRPGGHAIDWFHVVLQYERTRVVLQAGHVVADNSLRFAVHGTAASYIKTGLDVQEPQSREGLTPAAPEWGLDPQPGELVRQLDGQAERTSVPSERGSAPQFYAGVRDAILDGAPPPVTAEQALLTMRVLDAGLRSAAEGRRIVL